MSETLSPHATVVGLEIDYLKHCKLEFGTYVQTHEDHDNSMAARTTGAIALRPGEGDVFPLVDEARRSVVGT